MLETLVGSRSFLLYSKAPEQTPETPNSKTRIKLYTLYSRTQLAFTWEKSSRLGLRAFGLVSAWKLTARGSLQHKIAQVEGLY